MGEILPAEENLLSSSESRSNSEPDDEEQAIPAIHDTDNEDVPNESIDFIGQVDVIEIDSDE